MLSPVDAGLDPSVVLFLTAAGCKKCRYSNQIYSFQHIGDINRWLALKSATCVIELLSRVKPDDEREDFYASLVDWVDVVDVAMHCTNQNTVARYVVIYKLARVYSDCKCLRSNKHCALIGVALCTV